MARTLRLLAGLAVAAFVVQLAISVAAAVVSGDQPRLLWPPAAVAVYAAMVAVVAASDAYAARSGDRPPRDLPSTWALALVVTGAAVATAILLPDLSVCPPRRPGQTGVAGCAIDRRIPLRALIAVAGVALAALLLRLGRSARPADDEPATGGPSYGWHGVARIVLVQGDITELAVDAIVNAANSSLLGGGGVDGAIHRKGGPEILAECRRIRAERYPDGLPTGKAVATTGGRLNARWVIHTVGPVHSQSEDRSALLASCHTEALRVADELRCRTVAFPAISTGVYGYPLDEAAPVALAAVRGARTNVEEVQFCLFDDAAYAAFQRALNEIS